MSKNPETAKPALPDPKEVAKTYGEIAQRASKLINDHVHRRNDRAQVARRRLLGDDQPEALLFDLEAGHAGR